MYSEQYKGAVISLIVTAVGLAATVVTSILLFDGWDYTYMWWLWLTSVLLLIFGSFAGGIITESPMGLLWKHLSDWTVQGDAGPGCVIALFFIIPGQFIMFWVTAFIGWAFALWFVIKRR